MQQIALVRRTVHQSFFLRLGEELISSYVTDSTVIVAVKTVTIKEYSVGYKVTAEGIRLITWQLQTSGPNTGLWERSQMTTWEDDFSPYEVGTLGGKTPVEARAHREWEDDCYRPGNGSRLGQRDNADRQFQGYDYTLPQFYSTATRKD